MSMLIEDYDEVAQKYDERVKALKEKFRHKRLGDFTGAEFEAFLKLLGFKKSLMLSYLSPEELTLLENVLK